MNTALTSTYAVSSTYLIDSSSADNDEGFEIFQCTTETDGFTCDHFQPRSAATYSGNYRFDTGNLVKGMIYDFSETGKARWTTEFATLANAVTTGISMIAIATVALMF